MKSITCKVILLVVFTTTMFSFSSKFGGEGFELYLDDKLLSQQFGKEVNIINDLSLNPGAVNSQLIIKYYHCGNAGKNRIVAIKDGNNKILREWRFKDAKTIMNCNVKDILDLTKGNKDVLKLYYSSTELTKGRQLANLLIRKD